jgi:hypothetical protein
MRRRHLLTWLALGHLSLAACAVAPTLEEATGGIPVYEIVLRAKCELAAAFEDDEGDWLIDKYAKFSWLKNWTAQVDFTLQVLDQATLSPGVSAMTPLHNAYPTSVGPGNISTAGVPGTTINGVAQSVAIAAGVSLNGQAQRTETMAFGLSVMELREWRRNPNVREFCAIPNHMDLRGRLGLREWIRQALEPVVNYHELLYAGYHPKQGASPGPAKPSTGKPESKSGAAAAQALEKIGQCTQEYLESRNYDLTALQGALGEVTNATKELQSAYDTADNKLSSHKTSLKSARSTLEENKRQFGPVLDPAIRAAADKNMVNLAVADRFAAATAANLKNAKARLADANSFAAQVTTSIRSGKELIRSATAHNDKCDTDKIERAVTNATAQTEDAKANAAAAKENISAANTNLQTLADYEKPATELASRPIDPPISSIGQSVQFIVTYGGNVTPTWTFVTFKGPNNPLFAANSTRTHSLNITLGPSATGTNVPSADVKQNNFYLQLNNVLTATSVH